jgi:hypothetical protein
MIDRVPGEISILGDHQSAATPNVTTTEPRVPIEGESLVLCYTTMCTHATDEQSEVRHVYASTTFFTTKTEHGGASNAGIFLASPTIMEYWGDNGRTQNFGRKPNNGIPAADR